MKLNGINSAICSNDTLTCGKNSNNVVTSPLYSPNNIETSVYNQKGVSVPFCGLYRGTNAFEEMCAKALRKYRDGRYRMFTEDDIRGIMTSLKKQKSDEEKLPFIRETIEIFSGYKPDKTFLKNVIELTAGHVETQRYAILNFAEHELQHAKKPLEAFMKLPAEKKEKLIKILEKIDDVDINEINSGFRSPNDVTEINNALYDTFRTVVYADDDIAKIGKSGVNDYKIETLHVIRDDIEYFNNLDVFKNPKTKDKVMDIVKDIQTYYIENVL